MGLSVDHLPTVLGHDVAGTVVQIGESVKSFRLGDRVAAFAPAVYTGASPNYGAFQEKVLVPSSNAVLLPPDLSFTKASLLPVAVETAWAGWHTIGLQRDIAYPKSAKQGMLVWGGASSVGSAAVQIARAWAFTSTQPRAVRITSTFGAWARLTLSITMSEM